ncbi:hypothetical protein [Lachnoclostridium sp. MSJ-17]|uniref:hypothetical protein n=1 Tax=Lachnoclostridium sp. MSJ-17 TaxID=2841516 RepID=UPI001C1155E6|nr:hypothetical protein [Lachnoclostridium sp. MSJ-17]MBU5462730.1 hypothetical protein [Lachnoclostridium sp. MSJ-17]
MSQFHKKILAVLCSLLIGLCSISTAFAETSLPDGAVKGLPERLAALDDEGNPVNSEYSLFQSQQGDLPEQGRQKLDGHRN